MRFTWRSDKEAAKQSDPREYASHVVVESQVAPGVQFQIARISFERRLELMRRVRELGRQAEFLAAGASVWEKMDAKLLEAEIERTYVAWGIAEVRGLRIDGEVAGTELLIRRGPEALFREALAAVRRETGLSETERKNC